MLLSSMPLRNSEFSYIFFCLILDSKKQNQQNVFYSLTKIIFHHSNIALIFHVCVRVFLRRSFFVPFSPRFYFVLHATKHLYTNIQECAYTPHTPHCTRIHWQKCLCLCLVRVTQTQRNLPRRTYTRTRTLNWMNASTWLQMPVLFIALKSKVNLTHETKSSSLFFFYALKLFRIAECVPAT